MRILCAPDSFKGSMSAPEAAQALAAGAIAGGAEEAIACPIADGGEGTLDALDGADVRYETVSDALGRPIRARWAVIDGRTALIEMAESCGLARLTTDERDPQRTSSFGVGELIRAALRGRSIDGIDEIDEIDEIIVAVGGTATCDGGAGLLAALGVALLERDGVAIKRPTGGDLMRIAAIDPSTLIQLPPVRVACDVENPLIGSNGAAVVYGPQKGATARQVAELEAGLEHWASLLGNVDPCAPRTGAAGGAGFALAAAADATLESGIDLVLGAVDFAARCRGVDMVITGEGRLDSQTLADKACAGVARTARAQGVKHIVGIVGTRTLDDTAARSILDGVIALDERFGLDAALHDTAKCLSLAAEEAVRQWL